MNRLWVLHQILLFVFTNYLQTSRQSHSCIWCCLNIFVDNVACRRGFEERLPSTKTDMHPRRRPFVSLLPRQTSAAANVDTWLVDSRCVIFSVNLQICRHACFDYSITFDYFLTGVGFFQAGPIHNKNLAIFQWTETGGFREGVIDFLIFLFRSGREHSLYRSHPLYMVGTEIIKNALLSQLIWFI